jgi:ribitol 2-dehydrogenase
MKATETNVEQQNSLTDKVVIITGASSGIGAATARALAKCGCKVTLAARSAEKLQVLADELGAAALAVPTDITVGAQVVQMVEKTVSHFGRVDVLFANAGIFIYGKVAEGDPDKWAQLLDVNLNGVLRCVHAVLPHMTAQQSGDIIITSSISGVVDIAGEPIYSASKHAIQTLAHTLRRQLAPDGIRVGSIAPGMVANEIWGYPAEKLEELVAKHASLRSEDVAEAVIFMLSRPRRVTIRDLVMIAQRQDA